MWRILLKRVNPLNISMYLTGGGKSSIVLGRGNHTSVVSFCVFEVSDGNCVANRDKFPFFFSLEDI